MDIFNLVAKLTLDTTSYERSLQESGSLLGAVSGGAQKAAETFTPLSRAVFGFGQNAVQTAMSFDASMQKVIAINGQVSDEQVAEAKRVADEMGLSYEEGADATETALNILRAKAEQMGADTMFTASQAADALTYMAMAGWKTSDMLQGIGGVMSLAAAGGSDLALTSDIVTDALTAMGHGAEDAGRLSDIMAAAATNSNTNVEMMGETFKYAAPLIGTFGYSMEDTALAIGLMANSGTKASRAGTALRTILTNLASDSPKVTGALDELGVTLQDENGNMYSFREVMQQLRDGFSGLKLDNDEFAAGLKELDSQLEAGEITEDDYTSALARLEERTLTADQALQAQTAATIAGKFGLSGFLAIVNASEEDFNNLATAIDNSTGSAETMSGVMLDSLSGNMTMLKSKFEALQITLAEVLMPFLNQLTDWAKGFLDWLNGLDDKTVNIIVTIGTFIAVIAPVLGLVSKIASGISVLITILPTVIGFIGSAATAIGHITLLFNPWVLAIGAVIAALVLLWNNSETFRDIVLKVIDAVVEGWNKFKEAVALVVNQYVEDFKESWRVIKEGWNTLLEWFKGLPKFFSDLWTNIQQGWESFKQGLAVVWEAIVKVFTDAWAGIKESWEEAKKWFADLGDKINEAFQNAGKKIEETWNGIVEWFKGIPDKIKAFFSQDWTVLGSQIVDGIKQGLTNGIERLKKAVTDVSETVKSKFKNFFGISSPSKLMASYGKYLDEGLAEGIEDNQNDVERAMNGLSDLTMSSFDPKLGMDGVSGTMENITINVYGAEGQNVRELAEEVSQLISSKTARKRAVYA